MYLTTAINERFRDIESNKILSLATLLDPRHKERGFSDSIQAKAAVLRLISEVEVISDGMDQNLNIAEEMECSSAKTKSLIWDYDSVDEDEDTPSTAEESEVTTYLKTKRIERQRNPLLWWKMQEAIFPRLAKLTRKILCIPATSVPSERVFSKTGELVSARRANIKACNVDMIVFLNKIYMERINREKEKSKQNRCFF